MTIYISDLWWPTARVFLSVHTSYGEELFHQQFLDACDPLSLELSRGRLHRPHLHRSAALACHRHFKPPVVLALHHFTKTHLIHLHATTAQQLHSAGRPCSSPLHEDPPGSSARRHRATTTTNWKRMVASLSTTLLQVN